VRKGTRGAEIVLSRAHEGFIRGLFALEVPEISDGTVEIKAIAREPGDRTKIAVVSTDERVDSQGACIGMRGTRVKNIVRELHGERVDIIRWHENITEYIAAALAPATIAKIQIDEAARQALIIVDDDQLSLAIGKKGQNVRLASKLTGWQLEINSGSQRAEVAVSMALRDVRGVGPAMQERLTAGGVTSVEQLASATAQQLAAIKGIGEKTAGKLIEAAKQALQAGAAHAEHAEPGGSTPQDEATAPERPISEQAGLPAAPHAGSPGAAQTGDQVAGSETEQSGGETNG